MSAKIIEWAFLCASAELDGRGGVNIEHLHDKFLLSDLPGLTLVFKVGLKNYHLSGGHTIRPFDVLPLMVVIETETQEEVDSYSTEILMAEEVTLLPIGRSLSQPGRYALKIMIDGLIQHTLDLFLD